VDFKLYLWGNVFGIQWISGLDVVAGKTCLSLLEITAIAQQACTSYTELTNNTKILEQ
jgi:hypothetical protein